MGRAGIHQIWQILAPHPAHGEGGGYLPNLVNTASPSRPLGGGRGRVSTKFGKYRPPIPPMGGGIPNFVNTGPRPARALCQSAASLSHSPPMRGGIDQMWQIPTPHEKGYLPNMVNTGPHPAHGGGGGIFTKFGKYRPRAYTGTLSICCFFAP